MSKSDTHYHREPLPLTVAQVKKREELTKTSFLQYHFSALPSLQRSLRARPASGAPLLRKYGNLSIREILVVT